MPRTFFTSDLHLGHANVIRFDRRPFGTVEEMDSEIIRRWNEKVHRNDTVYVVGDFLWSSHKQDARELIHSLKGKKILIKGNHDKFLLKTDAVQEFEDIMDYAEITVRLADNTGHSHNTDESRLEREMAKFLRQNGLKTNAFNVGCMYWDYYPVTLDEILPGMR